MSIDSIGNFLTIIRNGLMVSKPSITAPYARMNEDIVHVLKEEGFIRDFVISTDDAGKKSLKVIFKYVDNESVIHEITRKSKPSRRVYVGTQKIEPVISGLGVSILTTSKGVMSHKKAESLGVGGELICTIW